MISTGETIRVVMRPHILQELHDCEYGSYEDHVVDLKCKPCEGFGKVVVRGVRGTCAACNGKGTVLTRLEPYDKGRLHIVELIERSPYKSLVELQTEEEINEFFVQACTGTFGIYHLRTLQRIYKQLEPFVDVATKGRVSYGSLGY
jgi:RecJ-like exonuclease